ncbi:MAG TPA: hypothetical protein VLA68_03515 [Nitrososphaera sp.]|nr:hypothetical protein [Nitrososphaera sp.]
MSEARYPVSQTYTVLDGYDIYRSDNLIVALVVVQSQFGKDLRLYRWMKRKDQWKVDLCRMGVGRWKWDEIAAKAREFVEKYGLKGKQTSDQEGSPPE